MSNENIIPIYAEGIHIMDNQGNVNLVLIFEYLDEDLYYAKLVRKGGKDLLEEMKMLMENMQKFLDEEIIEINGKKSRPIVQDVHIGFRGDLKRPYIEFYITFSGPIKKGLNRYDNWYEEEIAEYDYEILWVFPQNFRIRDYYIVGEGKIIGVGNILVVHVKKGMKVGKHEWIEFEVL